MEFVMTVQDAYKLGFVDLPCRVSNHRRWDGEYLIKVMIPGEEQPRLLFAPHAAVDLIDDSDPNNKDGARGTIRVQVQPETKHSGYESLIIGIPGDHLFSGYSANLSKEYLATFRVAPSII